MSKALAQNSRIIARTIRSNDGTPVIGFFAIYEEKGGYSVRLVGIRPIGNHTAQNGKIFLPTLKTPSSSVLPLKSPYFSDTEIFSQNFSFLTSQPARAPAAN
ncbi:MAG TPA: hypothetical protein VMR73_01735 [Candidatus Paceibacterota bacterium]|nr:hypothetical protein [Candidatus Paceibacterota bacterium]